MNTKELVAYCGLYCDLCSARTKQPQLAAALRECMRKADFEDWGPSIPGFTEFWSFLGGLTEVPEDRYCRSGKCGSPRCAIRKCAIERNLEVCPECEEYPCAHILTLGRSEPTLVHDGQRIRQIGLEAWIAEQEERGRLGFCYSDVRCGSCVVPEE